MHHPHLHCLVPAGGLSPDREQWIHAREGFLVPVRVLSRLFRGLFLAELRAAGKDGKLKLAGRLALLGNPGSWQAFLGKLQQTDWVVYANPPFGSPGRVLKYLARYTHRVAISNQRLVCLAGGQVTFRYKEYRTGHRQRFMRLGAVEFIRRFLLHSLPKGFVRIRHYGLLANHSRQKTLAVCRRLLGQAPNPQSCSGPKGENTKCETHFPCPKCNHSATLVIAVVPPVRAGPEPFSSTYLSCL